MRKLALPIGSVSYRGYQTEGQTNFSPPYLVLIVLSLRILKANHADNMRYKERVFNDQMESLWSNNADIVLYLQNINAADFKASNFAILTIGPDCGRVFIKTKKR